ncbi:MAG: type I-C CRISPR-associated protein Cas5c [Eubacteriales bacterium]|nr:type I-C CRISPR-associated protein Cas5c [Eubacteriales bacterium]
MSILMEVWGPMACFTRPEMKTERVSYEVPTPGAVRGMIESVFFHPGLRWVPDRIWVLNRIQFMNVRRNEVKSKVLASAVLQEANGGKAGAIFTSEDIQQRAAMLLKDVRYVFEAHFEMTVQANPSDNHGKFQDIVKRRLRRGACYSTPYFGCRECTAHFRLWEGGEIPAIDETRDLGYMLYDMDYSDPTDIQPMFFRARMEHGVIDLRNCEVVR